MFNHASIVSASDVFQHAKPVLLDFWAEWCAPCRALNPVLEEVARALPHVQIIKVNVGDQPALASEFGVQRLPTLLFVRDGCVRGQIRAVPSKTSIVDAVSELDVAV